MPTPLYSWLTDPRVRAERLEEILPPDRLKLLRLVADEAAAQRLPLYIVGGFVRDLLLGFHSLDFDLVVEGDAIKLGRAVAKKFGGKIIAHLRFGTIKWFLPDSMIVSSHSSEIYDSRLSALDIISARTETYTYPGALPKIKSSTLSDDLRRRDFTINTLTLRLDGEHFGELRDDPGSLEDLNRGVVRVMHPGSYNDDPTRILRAVRYEQRYSFRISPSDLQSITVARFLLLKLSADRLRHELNLILAEEKAADMLARLAELDILKYIHPSLPWDADLHSMLKSSLNMVPPVEWGHIPDLPRIPFRIAVGYLLWLVRLSTIEIESLDSRLHFPAKLRNTLFKVNELWRVLPDLMGEKPSVVATRLEGIPLLAIYITYLIARQDSGELLNQYVVRWRHIKPKTTGHDLLKYSLPPGPVFDTILHRLREAWLDGDVNTVAEERAFLENIIKNR